MSFPNKKPYSPPMSNVAYTNVPNDFSVAQVVLGSQVLTTATGALKSSNYAMKNESNTFNQVQVINSPGPSGLYNYSLSLNNGLRVGGDTNLQGVSCGALSCGDAQPDNVYLPSGGKIQIDGVNVVTTTTGASAYAPLASMPIGSMVVWPGISGIPPMWHLCDGSSLDELTYPDLFSALGYTYGGGGGFGFILPNLNNRFVLGSSGTNINLNDGQSQNVLETANIPWMPLVTGIDSTHQPLCLAALIPSGNGSSPIDPSLGPGSYNSLTSGSPIQVGVTKSYVGANFSGGQTPFSNIPPCIGFNYIIYTGVF